MRGSDRLAFERRFSRRKIDSTTSTAVDRNPLSQFSNTDEMKAGLRK
jgi:hypothetical protein